MMKIVILSLASRFGDVTGDCVQAEKTVDALRTQGEDVSRCFLKGTRILDESGQDCGSWRERLRDCDIVHTIPPIPWRYLSIQEPIRAKLVASTVFWRSLTYLRVLHRTEGLLSFGLAKEYVRVFLAWLGLPTYRSYEGFDLLLPNSEDEVRTFNAFCRRKGKSICRAVPNAIDSIPDFVDFLPRPKNVPASDYVVVPAVFAARKNHLAFIRAVQGLSYPVVFMGNGDYLEECRRIAGEDMYFLGYVKHGCSEFYSVLKYARVVCLPSNCETPGIAGLEAAALGARPVMPYEGGTAQYYAWDAEYLDPLDARSMRAALEKAWMRGRLPSESQLRFRSLTWRCVAERTIEAYHDILSGTRR